MATGLGSSFLGLPADVRKLRAKLCETLYNILPPEMAAKVYMPEVADALIADFGLQVVTTPDIAGELWGVHKHLVSSYGEFVPGPNHFAYATEPTTEGAP